MNLKKINLNLINLRPAEFQVVIFLFILILNIGALYLHIASGYEFNSNTRTSFDGEFYKNLIHCYEVDECSYKQINSTADDPGHMGLFFFNYLLFPSDSSFDPKDYNSFPTFVQFFYLLSFWVFLGIYFFNAVKIWGLLVATLGGLSFILFENFYHLAYSNDVYLFPVYGISAALIWFSPTIFSKKYIYALGIYCGILEWFRVGSGKYFLVGALIYILFYNNKILSRRREMLNYFFIIILSWLVSLLPKVILSNAGHSLWHAIHAGMFEEGGVEISGHRFVPNFLIDEFKNEEVRQRFGSWSDQNQFAVVLRTNPKAALGSVEYDHILKNDYLNLVKAYPRKFLEFYVARFLKVIDLNPWKQHEADSHYQVNRWTSRISLAVFLFFIGAFLISPMSSHTKILFLAMMSLSLVGPILIHPTYVMYNISFYWMAFLLIYIVLSYRFTSRVR
ncbi:MAG: hypothetical protein QE271_13665 [Bacteriovoracaceae bacterium]|nr:hypothetical protein [Bacteriovoracaceae bacterium]